MTTPQLYVEDVIVDIVKTIAPERATTRDEIAKITECFDFRQVLDEITALSEDETLVLLDTLAQTFPQDTAQEHITSTFMTLLLAKEAALDE